jgi:hypothetical protein
MDKELQDKIIKSVDEAMHKLKAAGVKAEVLHEHIRSALESYRFKRIQKGAKHLEKELEEFKKHIEAHLVIKSEDDEYNILVTLIKEIVYIYFTLHSLHLFEKHDLNELRQFIDDFEKRFKNIDKGALKVFQDNMRKILDEWAAEFEKEREKINSVWAEVEGRQGFALTVFMKTHNLNYMARKNMRSLFRETLKDEATVEKYIDRLKAVKNADQLRDVLTEIEVKEREMTEDYSKVWSFIDAWWQSVTKKMEEFVKLVYQAAAGHELPSDDPKQVQEITKLIVERLDKNFLQGLRIEIKQLEAIEQDIKKAA